MLSVLTDEVTHALACALVFQYVITGKNEREWPEPLQRDHTSPHTREFFDSLDAMQLRFSVGMSGAPGAPSQEDSDSQEQQPPAQHEDAKMFEWRIAITYDLQSQSHLEVAMNYALRQRGADANELEDLPPMFFDSSTTFNVALLVLIYLYQVHSSFM